MYWFKSVANGKIKAFFSKKKFEKFEYLVGILPFLATNKTI